MAVELAQAYVSIIPSAKGIQSRLSSELDGPLRTAGTTAGDNSANAFRGRFVAGLSTAGKAGAVALGAGFATAGFFAVKTAADFEQTQIAFEGILGSAGAADELLGNLRDFAAKSPFEFTGLTDSAKQLLGVGFASEDIIPTMSTLGDVAATLGVGADGIKGTVRALGQMKGKGKASAEELQQISEQLPGFSAIEAIAKDMGISTSDAFKLMEKGAIPADDAIASILAGMETFPGASGAMERQSKTLNGVISTFKDTLSTTAIDFITPYLPAISAGVAAFGGFISQTLVPGVQSVIDIFGAEGAGGIFSRLGELIQTEGPILGQQLLNLGGEFVTWIKPQIGPMLGELLNYGLAVQTWLIEEGVPLLATGALALAAALFEWVTDPEDGAIVGLLEALPGFVDAFTSWITNEMFPAAFNGGKEIGSAFVAGFFESLGDTFALPPGATLHVPGTPDDWEIDLPGKALGGRVQRNRPFIVGEHRPELFVPDQSGTIIPEVPGGGMGGGGPLIGSLTVIEKDGENPVHTAMRELKRVQLLVA